MTTETDTQKPTMAFFLLQGTYSSYTWIYRTTQTRMISEDHLI